MILVAKVLYLLLVVVSLLEKNVSFLEKVPFLVIFPSTIHHPLSSLHPSPFTLHHSPFTIHPSPFTIYFLTISLQLQGMIIHTMVPLPYSDFSRILPPISFTTS